MDARRLISILFCILVIIVGIVFTVDAQPQVPCYFIFGDSLSDSGNNNPFFTFAKVNYAPYGIDFPGRVATGRFTDGFTFVDIIAQKLGLPLSPPYEGNPANITCGVNYASGGGGIRPETGFLVGEVLNIQQQLENHKIIIAKLKKQGINNLSECLYTVNMGTNDYINNYYALGYSTWLFYTPEEYAADLITRYREFLQEMFSLGARKVALFSLGPLGCLPSQITIHFATQGSVCFEDENSAIGMFNQGVRSLVDEFNANYTGAKFTYINYGGIFPKPNTQGFKFFNEQPCCPIFFITGLCSYLSTPCQNRSNHIYWDNYHPTSAVHKIIGTRAYAAQVPTDAYPVDISHLVEL
ncbi:GDSL esterase/lipase-like protein [Drosera capensis]